MKAGQEMRIHNISCSIWTSRGATPWSGGSLTLTSDFGVLFSTFESHIWIRNVQVREAPEILLLNGHQSPKKEKNSPHQPYYSENAFLFLCSPIISSTFKNKIRTLSNEYTFLSDSGPYLQEKEKKVWVASKNISGEKNFSILPLQFFY